MFAAVAMGGRTLKVGGGGSELIVVDVALDDLFLDEDMEPIVKKGRKEERKKGLEVRDKDNIEPSVFGAARLRVTLTPL